MSSIQSIRASGSGIDLSRFRYHTGAQPTRIASEEPCPALFRDVGLEPMIRFIRGKLRNLCGILSPITYLRTADYCEPYIDYGCIGRIMLLEPQSVSPWHSGIESIYIAPREIPVDRETMVFVPSDIPLADSAAQLSGAHCLQDVADIFGPRSYEDARLETLARLDLLEESHMETERLAAPLRRLFQSMEQRDRDRARTWMQRQQLGETDVCSAWHHLPTERRNHIQEALRSLR